MFGGGRVLGLSAVCGFAAAAWCAGAGVPAVVAFSDGASAAGELAVIGSRPLTLVPFGDNHQRMIRLEDMVSIDHEVEKSSLERPWVFKESGKAEKVYLDGQYPLLNFKTTVTLVSGEVVSGHILSAAFTLKTDAEKRKVFLQRQIKGEIGQPLAEVVYPAHVRLTAAACAGGGPLAGRVEGFGRVESVTALDNERGNMLFARVTPDGRFDFGTVLPGSYDLCVLTDTHVIAGHSDAVPSGAASGAALQAADIDGVCAKVPLADDFFNDRFLVALRGNRSVAKALMYERRSKYYEASKWTPGGFLWHLEVWTWHLAGDEWKLDQRHILIRHKQQGGEKNRTLVHCALLDAVKPGTTCAVDAETAKREGWDVLRNLE